MDEQEINKFNFFVYIVESPSPIDLYKDIKESELIKQGLNLNKIPCISRITINREAFTAALSIGLSEAMQEHNDLIPVIHISCHGSSEGIALSSGEFIAWDDLKEYLKPINKSLNNNLLVSLSSCEGHSGTRMAMYPDQTDQPFFALVGCAGKPTWSETAIAYSTYYHLLSKGEFISKAVNAMRIASGNALFFVEQAIVAQNQYIEYLNNQQLENAQLEINSTNSEDNELQKYKKE